MTARVQIGDRFIGDGAPCYVVAEIGINHNGDVEIAKKLIDAAVLAGCDAVKFQKRTPELCVPPEQRQVQRDTPWGPMSYLEYRERLELDERAYAELDRYCLERGIAWFASCWDEPSVETIARLDPVCYKIASACLTDHALLSHTASTRKPLILSTGMSTMDEIREAVSLTRGCPLLLAHSTSSYPCRPEELNLTMIGTLRREFGIPVGYSGHEVGLQTSLAAVVLGACFIERHITLDRAMWGTDHAASVEPWGLMRLVRDIRTVEKSLGDGVKKIYESELAAMKKLRRHMSTPWPA